MKVIKSNDGFWYVKYGPYGSKEAAEKALEKMIQREIQKAK